MRAAALLPLLLLLAVAVSTQLVDAACSVTNSYKPGVNASDPRRHNYGCTYNRKIQCDSPPKRRAIVIYVFYVGDQEYGSRNWDNFAFFIHNGLMTKNATTIHKRVDFVFARVSNSVYEPTPCAKSENMKLIWIPPSSSTGASCELCDYSRVADYIGVKSYDSVIFLNSNARGPFVGLGSSNWVDIVTTAGHVRPQNANADDDVAIVSGAQLGWQNAIHPQSYFMVVPRRLFKKRLLLPLFRHTCELNTQMCLNEGEYAVGTLLLKHNVSLYSLGRDYLVTPEDDLSSESPLHKAHVPSESLIPAQQLQDPCQAVFTQFGGEVWHANLVHRATIRTVRRLSALMVKTRSEAQPIFSKMLDDNTACQWLN